NLRNVSVGSPFASFVGIGHRRERYLAAECHVVEFAADGTEAGFNFAKTLAVSQLSECHRQILIPTGQIFQIATTAISVYALLELLVGKELDQLREDGAPSVHPALSMFRTRPPRTLQILILHFNSFLRQTVCLTLTV